MTWPLDGVDVLLNVGESLMEKGKFQTAIEAQVGWSGQNDLSTAFTEDSIVVSCPVALAGESIACDMVLSKGEDFEQGIFLVG